VSYDIYLRKFKDGKCPTCGCEPAEPDLPNPTYNLTPIFDLALAWEDLPNPEVGEAAVVLLGEQTSRPRGLRLLSGKKAEETVKQIALALSRLCNPANEARFRDLEPPNKWGDLEGAQEVMGRLLSAAKEYPHHIWEIH
jgi:hypothetical protein